MQLSFEIIKRRLEIEYTVSVYGVKHTRLALDRPKFYYPGINVSKGGFYVVGQADFGREDWNGCFVICAGEVQTVPESTTIRLMAIGDSTPEEIINSVNDVYDFYDRWDMSLRTLPKTGSESVFAMLDASIPVFDNIIRLMNTNFRFEYVSDEEREKTLDVPHPDESGFIPLDIVNYFKNDKYYNEMNEVKTPYIFPAGILPFRSLCANLFSEGKLIGRIIINEVNRPIHETDSSLVSHLAKYVKDAYLDLLQASDPPIFEMKYAIGRALDGSDPGAADLIKLLGKYQWTRNDTYACLWISSVELISPERHYVCREFEKHNKGTCAIEYDENIVVVANLTLGGQTLETLLSSIKSFAKEGFYKIGASTVFSDISDLKWHYLQARIALQTGLPGVPANWIFHFEDYRLKYLMGKCSEELLPEFMCPAELLKLKQQDKDTGTNYYESLSLYLKNCRNAVQTAETLFIHRLTLVYRLNRIKELTPLRWDTPEEYFALLLSINILENSA